MEALSAALSSFLSPLSLNSPEPESKAEIVSKGPSKTAKQVDKENWRGKVVIDETQQQAAKLKLDAWLKKANNGREKASNVDGYFLFFDLSATDKKEYKDKVLDVLKERIGTDTIIALINEACP